MQPEPHLHVHLLGNPTLAVDHHPPDQPRLTKVMALAAFLAMERLAPHSRSRLADLLWSHLGEADARRNLTQTLTRLRKQLGDRDRASRYFTITQTAIGLRPDAPVSCDAAEFLRLVAACEQHAHASPAACDDCQARLATAHELVRSEFMAGFAVGDAEPFEDWLLLWRERLHEARLKVLFALGEGTRLRGDWPRMQALAQEQIELEPWREKAHRQLMEALAREGRRAAAIAQFEQCQAALREEMGMEVSAETTTLLAAVRRGELAPAPTPPPTRPSSVNLPADTTPFIGRAAEIAAIAARLAGGDYRLVTLLGQGGIGKTRLAIAVARHMAERADSADTFDQVAFVPLAGVESAESLPQAIATALGLALEGAQPAAQLLERLRRSRALLILDNFEHLVDADDAIALIVRLLTDAPAVRLLVTSRAELGLLAEDLFEVHGLPLPQADAGETATARSDAVQLFLDRARRVDKQFRLSADNAPAVVAVCTLVAGLPLGIELATSWLRHKTVADIAAGMAQSFDSVATRLRDIAPRHRSLRAVFDYSWGLLADDQRRLLAHLAVFRGGFDAQAARDVAGAASAQLGRLRAQSLLQQVSADRYDLHPLVRQFSAETLPPDAAVFTDHSRYYLRLLTARAADLSGAQPRAVGELIVREIDNTRRAWLHAVDRRHWCDLAPAVVGLQQFALQSGRLAQVEPWVAAALTALTADAAAEHPALLADLQLALAALVGRQRDTTTALTLAQTVTAWAEAVDDSERAARACLELGFAVHRMEAGTARELTLFRRALAHARRGRHVRLTAVSLRHLAWSEVEAHEWESAETHFREALTIQQRLGDVTEQQWLLTTLGINAIARSQYAVALGHLEQAAALLPVAGHQPIESRIANALGFTRAALGDLMGALPHHERALRAAVETGEPVQESMVLTNLATINRKLGRLTQAEALARRAYDLAAACRSDGSLLYARLHWGYVLIDAGEPAAAAELLAQPLDKLEENPALHLETQAALAEALRAGGEVARALGVVEPLVGRLSAEPLFGGADEPFQVYLNVWHTLHAAGDPRAAPLLARARAHLHAIADQIDDDDVRCRFLSAVPAHRELVDRAGSAAQATACNGAPDGQNALSDPLPGR